MIGLFVDDMIVSYNTADKAEWNQCKQHLKNTYELSDMGSVEHILGMRVKRTNTGGVSIDQRVYVDEKLKIFDMEHSEFPFYLLLNKIIF